MKMAQQEQNGFSKIGSKHNNQSNLEQYESLNKQQTPNEIDM